MIHLKVNMWMPNVCITLSATVRSYRFLVSRLLLTVPSAVCRESYYSSRQRLSTPMSLVVELVGRDHSIKSSNNAKR